MKSGVFILLLSIVGFACNNNNHVVPASVRLEQDIATIDQYLADRGITAVKDSLTGVQYVIKELGTGVKPTAYDCVRAAYTGTLLTDGTVIDQSTDLKIALRNTVAGWQVAFPFFPKGTKATIYIPSYYGYGASSPSASIPANSILIFDVEVLDVYAYNSTGGYCYEDPTLPEAEQNAKDAAIISQYLTDNSITAQTDASGLRYVVQSLGTGPMPTLSSCVRVAYTGKLLTGSTFDQSTNYKEALKYLIKGWQIGLPLFPKGSKVTLYIPSRLAYGTQSAGSKIPANANLMFDIEILDVTDFNASTNSCN